MAKKIKKPQKSKPKATSKLNVRKSINKKKVYSVRRPSAVTGVRG